VAFGLFVENGFDETTVDEIAAAAGISRRTFFRYFATKNDLPWGEFDLLITEMHAHLSALPPEVPLVDGVRGAVRRFNSFPAEEVPHHRRRMQLLLNVPGLQAHSTLRYAAWRQAIAEFAGGRLGEAPESLRPQSIGWAFLSVSLAAYEEWLRNEDADLVELMDRSFVALSETLREDGSYHSA